MNNLGNERWLNRTWTTSRSVPISRQLPSNRLQSTYKYMILDLSTYAQGEFGSSDFGEFRGSYGTDELPAICEYG